ncbi:MAG: hypothetical protein IKH32_00290 [Prevotella sp.]|nr:hypothetical protein [Prevotella sp.]
MSESHLQVNLDGTTANRKTVLWPNSKKEQESIVRSLFEQNNWRVSEINHQSGSFWKVITTCNGKTLKINLYISSVRDEDRQADEFKMQLGNTYPKYDEEGWITLVLGIYTIAQGYNNPKYILSGYDRSRYDFSTNPSIRGTRTAGLQKAYTFGMYKTEKSILFRPEFIYYYIEYTESLFGNNVKQASSEIVKVSVPTTKQLCDYLSAIRTKPFLLLAGISGTGKSRIVRKLAQATDDIDVFAKDEDRWKMHKPANFELIQVKPNWHNSMDVVGFKSNIGREHYEFTPFVDFVLKAWQHEKTPFFLCLDEMNLAPVEEYFAEFLSAIENRAVNDEGEYETDPIIKPFDSFGPNCCGEMMRHIREDLKIDLPLVFENKLRRNGLTLPKNLIVMGTVNMDETTFSFSRKVLDRAMSIEMNKVNYTDFLAGKTEEDINCLTTINGLLVDRPTSAQQVKNDIDGEAVISYLSKVNDLLDGTPFKLGYRAANEAMLYVAADKELGANDVKTALDDFTLMKILSRIEGDDEKLVTKQGNKLLDALTDLLRQEDMLGTVTESKSLAKLNNMSRSLGRDHFVSFWG